MSCPAARIFGAAFATVAAFGMGPWVAEAKIINGFEVDERVDAGPASPGVNLARLDDGGILTVASNRVYWSGDLGQTWDSWALNIPGHPGLDIRSPVLCVTENGPIVAVGMEFSTYNWSWNTALNAPNPSCALDVWAMRSLDGGKTWVDAQMLLDGYCGAVQDIIQTSTGEVIVPVQPMLYDEARHATRPYVSRDDGLTWEPSDLIDIGGRGHHDGAIEGTLVELEDNRVWMLLRTNLDQFYSVYSSDMGDSWSDLIPSQIDASSSPGYITRLASGRLAMAWNRLYPEGETSYPRMSGQYSATPASWMRHELSFVLSENDGQTWSEPVVIARLDEGQRVSYPTIFEPYPGRLWISTAQGGARLALNEADFLDDFDYVFEMPVPPRVTDRLDSEDFAYKYEFDVDPTHPAGIDLDANSVADFAKGGTGTFTLTGRGTIVMDSGPDSSAYLESGINNNGNLWPNVGFKSADGFTLEWRIKVIEDTGVTAAFALVADPADTNELPVMVIGDDYVEFGGTVFTPKSGAFDNADDFHTFRLVRDTTENSNLWWLWRDGDLLTPLGATITREYVRNAVYFGDIGTNYDGIVEMDYFRLTPGAYAPAGVEGDLNGDGLVGSADLDIVRANWGRTTAPGDQTAGDASGDGRVDSADLDMVRANWGAGVAPSAVPEPATSVMLVLCMYFFPAVGGRNRD